MIILHVFSYSQGKPNFRSQLRRGRKKWGNLRIKSVKLMMRYSALECTLYMWCTCTCICRYLETFVRGLELIMWGKTLTHSLIHLFIYSFSCREYEEKQLKVQQFRSKKTLEYSNQITRLQNQLNYEKERDTKGTTVHVYVHVHVIFSLSLSLFLQVMLGSLLLV